MKCPQCGLNNLSHVSQCVKCGAVLTAPASSWTPADCKPPRAGILKFVRALFYAWRRNYGKLPEDYAVDAKRSPEMKFNDRIGQTQVQGGTAGRIGWWRYMLDSFPTLISVKHLFCFCLNIIPGLGTCAGGRCFRGALNFLIWLVLLLLGLNFYGSWPANIFLGLMLVAHFAALYDTFPFVVHRGRVQEMYGVCGILLMGLIILYGGGQFAASFRFQGFNVRLADYVPVFYPGDFVLIRKSDTYRRGDIVLFHRPHVNYDSDGRGRILALPIGDYCDRVIGLPGEIVKLSHGDIYINGQKLDRTMYPINNVPLVGEWEMELDNETYFIINSYRRIRLDVLKKYGQVSREDIRGRIFMIWQPMSRRQFINPAVPAEKVKSNG